MSDPNEPTILPRLREMFERGELRPVPYVLFIDQPGHQDYEVLCDGELLDSRLLRYADANLGVALMMMREEGPADAPYYRVQIDYSTGRIPFKIVTGEIEIRLRQDHGERRG